MRLATAVFACLTALASAALAQTGPTFRATPPHIGYVYPAGGRQGTTFTVTVGGQGLDPADALVTGRGVKTRFLSLERPLNQKEFNELKEKAETLQAKRKAANGRVGADWTAEDEKALREIRQRLMLGPANRQPNPAIAERATFEITLDGDAAIGPHELRLKTASGLSNPLVFVVGQLTEYGAPAARPDPARRRDAAAGRAATPAGPPLEVTLPATVNGQILPGEVDHIRFTARKSQRVVVAVAARALIPYLADAVPGWIQATVTVQDSQGRQLAFADDFEFNPDPALMFEIPQDGDYIVEVADAIFRGREDFVYRVTLGEVPFITGMFPLGGPSTRASEVEVAGWNLPSARAHIDGAEHGAGEFRLSLRRGDLLSNAVPFEVGGGPEVDEADDSAPGVPQGITAPVTINGRIEAPDDIDVFKFSGRAGAKFVVEVMARRLNSPLDSIVRVTDASGAQVAANDDSEDRSSGLTTHHADSRVAFELPADGDYLVQVGDTQHRGGPDFAYRLHLRAPQPDFDVRVVPSSITVRAGACVPVTAHVLRQDGFFGPVTLALSGATQGLELSGARIPAGQDSIRFTIATGPSGTDRLLPLRLEASALVDGRRVVHAATPADDMMQAFAYRHLVPAQVALINVLARGGRPGGAPWLESGASSRIVTGGIGRVSLGLPPVRGDGKLVFELSEPPEGITLSGSRVSNGAVDLTFAAEAGRPVVGREGNLIVQVFLERPAPDDKEKKANAPRRIPLGVLPAIPFQIIEARK
jgi:hypothetical protein